MRRHPRPGSSAPAVALIAAFGLVSCGGQPARLRTELLAVPGYSLAAVKVLVTVGSANDPPGREGLCRLAWSLLAEGGSRATSRDDLAARLFPLGAEIGLSVDKDVSVFSGTVRAGDLGAFYSVFREALLDPGFREEDFVRVKARQLAFLEGAAVRGPGGRLAGEILDRMLHGGGPDGHPAEGFVSSVKALGLEDVKAFYRSHFLQGNIILGLGGDFDQDLLARATADFKALPRGSTPPPADSGAAPAPGLEISIAVKDVRSVSIRIGIPLPVAKSDKDYFPLWIAAAALRDDSPPFERRAGEDSAVVEGSRMIDAWIEPPASNARPVPAPNRGRRQGRLSIRLEAPGPAEAAGDARRVLDAIRKLAEGGIPDERLEDVRARLLAGVWLYARTLDEHLAWRMDSRLAGFTDFLDEASYALPRVKREDVDRVVRTYLAGAPVRMAVVAGGPESFISEFGAAAVRTVPADGFFKAPGGSGR